MSNGKKPDPRRKKTGAPHSTHFAVPNGAKELGYKAGEVYGCYGHRVHAHQPCLHELTDGELQCPFCTAGINLEWRGYVPLWDRDFTLRHALISEAYYESVDMIPHRAQVILSRDKPKMSALVIRAGDVATLRSLPEKAPWCNEVDMFAVCRVLWKNAAVDAWYSTTQGKHLESVGDAKPLDTDTLNPMIRAAAGRANRMSDPASVNARAVEAWKRTGEVPAPSKNGHHKKGGSDG